MRWLAFPLVLLTAGCGATLAALTSTGPPALKVATVELVATSATTGTVRFELRLPTEPGAAVQVQRVEWSLRVRNRRFANGLLTSASTTATEGETTLEVKAPLAFLETPEEGPADFALRGSVTVKVGNDERTYVFRTRQRGQVQHRIQGR